MYVLSEVAIQSQTKYGKIKSVFALSSDLNLNKNVATTIVNATIVIRPKAIKC